MSEVVFNRTAHMTLWLTIADRVRVTGVIPSHISDIKKEALYIMGFKKNNFPREMCFACEYADMKLGSCHCPLEDFECDDWPYLDLVKTWREYSASKSKVKHFYDLCIEIAMWPVQKEVICR